MKKDTSIFIEHILSGIRDIEFFMKDVSKEAFMENKEKQNAVIRAIEVIGEAVKNIPPSFKNKYLNIPWADIAGMRDKLIHHYFGVDLGAVWKVIIKDLPTLKEQIEQMKE